MRRTIRLSAELGERIMKAARLQGFPNATAFMRAALESASRENERAALDETEQRLTASIARIGEAVRRVQRDQAALAGLLDSFVKLFVTCVPEPTGDQLQRAVVAGKQRYQKFLKSAGLGLNGNSIAADAESKNETGN